MISLRDIVELTELSHEIQRPQGLLKVECSKLFADAYQAQMCGNNPIVISSYFSSGPQELIGLNPDQENLDENHRYLLSRNTLDADDFMLPFSNKNLKIDYVLRRITLDKEEERGIANIDTHQITNVETFFVVESGEAYKKSNGRKIYSETIDDLASELRASTLSLELPKWLNKQELDQDQEV